MGTVFSLDIRDDGDWTTALDAAVAHLHQVDRVFSTYRAGSDISRIRRGELSVAAADPSVARVLDRCLTMQRDTDGWFSALWDGRLDPTGLVKGWATEAASEILRTHGSGNHAVNGGGDVQLAGEPAPGQPWRVGVADPHRTGHTLATIAGRDFAVATSGSAERGAHIRNPFTGADATTLASVTVVGPRLTEADCYATAAFAMGPAAAQWLGRQPWHEGLVVTPDGARTATARFGQEVGYAETR